MGKGPRGRQRFGLMFGLFGVWMFGTSSPFRASAYRQPSSPRPAFPRGPRSESIAREDAFREEDVEEEESPQQPVWKRCAKRHLTPRVVTNGGHHGDHHW